MRFGVSTISLLALAWSLATVTPVAAETAPNGSALEDGLAVAGAVPRQHLWHKIGVVD